MKLPFCVRSFMNFNKCIDLHDHHFSEGTEQLHHPPKTPHAISL